MIGRISARLSQLEANPIVQYGLLVAITLLAAVLRFYKLGEWSFWIDEIFTVNRAQIHYGTLELIVRNATPVKNWVPISVISTAGALKVLGTSEWSARLVPAVIGIISVPALYFPIKRLFNTRIALVAALLLAVSTWHIFWSQNARFYTSLMLLYSLALFAFFWGLERDRPAYLVIGMLLFYLAVSERLFGLFLVFVLLCYLVLLKLLPFGEPPGFRLRNLLILSIPGLAAAVFEGYSLVTTGSSRILGDVWWFLLYRTDDPLRMLTFIAFNIGIPLMCFAFFGGLYLLLQRSRAGLLMFIAAVIPVVLILLLNPFIFTKDRYVFVILPSWIILGAVAVAGILDQAKSYGKLLAVGVLVLLLADAAGDNLLYYQINNGNRRDWKGAFALIQERSTEDDIVVLWWPELGNYYLDQEMISWQEIDPDTVAQSGHRYWFVIDSETAFGNREMKLWVEQNAELIDLRYLRTPDDFSLYIYFYDPERSKMR